VRSAWSISCCTFPAVGLVVRLFGGRRRPPRRRSGEYLKRGGAQDRLRGSDGFPSFHLVPGVRYGQDKLFLAEDSTGLLVDSTDARVLVVGILAGRMRGQG
jgi:hypothetical protein